MQRSLETERPGVAPSAFVSEMAYVIGDVTVGARASLWPFVCLRGDRCSTTVGVETNVQEFSMLHGATIGDEVTIGHNVVVDYATVEDHSLVGMSSTIQKDVTVESECLVAAGSLLTEGQVIPSGHLAYGAPAETRPLTDAQRAEISRVHELYVEHGRMYKREGHFEADRNGEMDGDV